MNQEIEIEFKNLLTNEEFERLKKALNIRENDFHLQKNYYFDTPTFRLKEKGAALRIREKQDTYTLTLKQPHEKGLLETHQALSKKDAFWMIETNGIIDGDVKKVLQEFGISVERLEYLGMLSTERAELKMDGHLLVLDHSHYLNIDDYELEFETTDAEKGRARFEQLLINYGIPIRKTDNKIKRFFQAKKLRNEGSK